MVEKESKTIALNRKAQHDYFIHERYEAGIELKGPEVKSLRQGKVSLAQGYAGIEDGEVYLYQVHIAPYFEAGALNPDPMRRRRLLLKQEEIRHLYGKVRQRGFTLIPLRIYFNRRGRAKIELALCKGKKFYDHRAEIRKRELKREAATLRKLRGR
jgi:SsrA-binding protein